MSSELTPSAMLIARGILMDRRKEQLRRELLEQEAEECPFRPRINGTSVTIAGSSDSHRTNEGGKGEVQTIGFSPSLSKRIKGASRAPPPPPPPPLEQPLSEVVKHDIKVNSF